MSDGNPKSYYRTDRFRPLSERFKELAEPGSLPTGHKLEDDLEGGSPAYVPRDPSRAFRVTSGAGAGLQLFNDGVRWVDNFMDQHTVANVMLAAREQLPEGQEYTIIISNSGGDESIEIMPSAQAPKQFLHSPDTKLYVRQVVGQNKGGAAPSNVTYRNALLQQKSVPVQPANTSPPPANSRRPNSIDREPRDIIRDGGDVPADSRLDRDHPNYRDPSGLA